MIAQPAITFVSLKKRLSFSMNFISQLLKHRLNTCISILLVCASPIQADVKSTESTMRFKLNGSTKMTLSQDGLGIGTTPEHQLQVSGNSSFSGNVQFLGGINKTPTLISGNVSSLDLNSSSLFLVNTTHSEGNITLPYSGNASGMQVEFKATSSNNPITFRVGSGNIDGQPFYQLVTDNSGTRPYLKLLAYLDTWHVLNLSGQGYAYPSRGLLLHTNLDNSVGTSSFSSNDQDAYAGTVTNTTFMGNAGIFNTALGFNGTNNYVDFDDPAGDALDPPYITVSCWVNPDILGATQYVISKNRDVSGTEQTGYAIILLASGQVRADFWNSVDNGRKNIDSVSSISTGEWSHLAMTYDGSTLKVYINGNEENSSSITGTIASGNRNLIFGALTFNPPNFFQYDGLLDDVFIYDRALSPSEITMLYQRGL
jgi:hypothetical protein